MNNWHSALHEVRQFILENKDQLIKWGLISLGATIALNLLLPFLPFLLIAAIPLAIWSYFKWHNRR